MKNIAILVIFASLFGCTAFNRQNDTNKPSSGKRITVTPNSGIQNIYLSGSEPDTLDLLAKNIDKAIEVYYTIRKNIKLGDHLKAVVSKLDKATKLLPIRLRRDSEHYIKDKIKVEIHYARSGRTPDGLSTDDEYTPYIFHNGTLVAIGWTTLGGKKTFGKKR